jgi:hypothetical protein
LHPGVWRTFKFDSIVTKIRTMEQVWLQVCFERKLSVVNLFKI